MTFRNTYVAPMTTSASSVITAINTRRPGLKPAKQHMLMFFMQGHHLAWRDRALFDEPMHATERAVEIDASADSAEPQITDEAALNTIGYVIARYSALSPADLRTLIQASQPWQTATKPGSESRIEWAHLRDWFQRPDETDDPDDERPNRAEVAAAEAYLTSRARKLAAV
ncbi:hypothetical protein ACWT_5868 [Actinoplanes sp. SE50]|nr:hypothetical protein ACPL_5999 [Actinoplanes sp. SE50/110]ATO85283.1 hypothetical protein ACWT_5868 [Actinoplanes sp. SE50]SLM02693.1 hypothetical protein ACSP50_5975 [Actinoplanes sp. SE50/110]